MGGEKDLEQLKKEAAAKAKAAALEKKKAQEAGESKLKTTDDLAKQKAAAAAKAKAAALAKKKAAEQGESPKADDAKEKAAAAAKAKAAALARKKAQEKAREEGLEAGDEKAKAAEKAKAKAAGGTSMTEEKVEAPSANQSLLDKYVKVIQEHLGKEVIEESYINRLSKEIPTLVIKKEDYFEVAEFLKYNEQLRFDYLSELHGTDFETHMELYLYLYSYQNNQAVAIKVKLDRDQPKVDSVVSLWAGANWPECEAYDLLGIIFTGHPNLHRIMLGEKWVGHPLRKDYEDQNELEV